MSKVTWARKVYHWSPMCLSVYTGPISVQFNNSLLRVSRVPGAILELRSRDEEDLVPVLEKISAVRGAGCVDS